MRWSLQRKLFVTVGAGTATLALLMSLLLDLTVVDEVQQHEDRALAQTQAAFEALQAHRRNLLLERCRLVSELPYFKAAVSVYDPTLPPDQQAEALATVTDMARRILERIDVDLITLTSGDGTPLISVGTALERAYDPAPLSALARHAMRHMTSDGFITAGDELVYVTAVQVQVGSVRTGALCLGTSLDTELVTSLEDMTGSAIVLLGRERIFAMSRSVPLPVQYDLRGRAATLLGSSHRELLELEGTRYRSLWIPFEGPGNEALGSFVVLRSEDDALAFLAEVREGLVLIASLAGAIALAFSFLFARHITVPLRKLVAFTERLGSGDLSAEVSIGTRDELGLLGESFNRMVQSLAQSRRELESSHRILEERSTELEVTNQDLRNSKEEMERVNRALEEAHAQVIQAGKMAAFGELGAGLAHDLKQPLASIRGFAQLVERRLAGKDADVDRNLKLIIESVDHMNQIVQGLKDFARKSNAQFRDVNVNDVLARTCLLFEGQMRAKRIKLEVDLERDLPLVRGEPNQLQQVFTNLLANARDALELEGGTVRVRSQLLGGGDHVVISVTDNGPGIPPEHLAKIWSSFFTTKPEGKGTGLGLSITEGIVADHGGRIDVSSRPHEATTFRIFLPARSGLSLAA
ncbi:MAG TPA: ATP-binding protein [Candidatus Eisenbacteria bacterium]|nr:ATP-binding protein [Candidatus Eisenbacteria bacterium]